MSAACHVLRAPRRNLAIDAPARSLLGPQFHNRARISEMMMQELMELPGTTGAAGGCRRAPGRPRVGRRCLRTNAHTMAAPDALPAARPD